MKHLANRAAGTNKPPLRPRSLSEIARVASIEIK